MNVIVAGSRSFADLGDVKRTFEVSRAMQRSPYRFQRDGGRYDEGRVETVIHGGAAGVDETAGGIAEARGLDVEVFEPDYEKYGSTYAPLRRNEEMAGEGDALVAVWDGESTGTRNMIEQALDYGLEVYVYRYDP